MMGVITLINFKILIAYLASIGILLFTPISTASTASTDEHHHQALKNKDSYNLTVHDYTIPDLTLIRNDGIKTSLAKEIAQNETVLLNFIFTSCTAICPVMSGTFAQVHAQLKDDNVRMISISIDPEYDTPERLNRYASTFKANTNWVFLTGNLQDIVTLQKAFNAYRGNKMNHTPITFMHTASDAQWVRLEGFTSATQIIDEYNHLNAKK